MIETTPVEAQEDAQSYLRALENLQKLRTEGVEPAQFWDTFVRILTVFAEAANGAIMTRARTQGAGWRVVATAPQSINGGTTVHSIAGQLDEVGDQCIRQGVIQWRHNGGRMAAVRLETGIVEEQCLAAFVLEHSSSASPKEIARRLAMASDTPAVYQTQRMAGEARRQVEHLAGVLDLMVVLNQKTRFLPAAMTFCNEAASRLHCERVSLGWLMDGYIRMQATSHVDRFERTTDAVQMLEAAMEEALDQDREVTWPEAHGGGIVSRDHKAFARAHDTAHICSLPLRLDGAPIAVCTAERTAAPFSENELRLLRLFCDQAARRLADLKKWDLWFGARLVLRLKEAAGRLIGFEHTGLKILGVALTLLLLVLVFGKAPYRVSAPLTLRTDDMAVLTAPFDGHIEKVNVRIGDNVRQGQQLLALDTTDLVLSEAQILAQKESYQGEFEKARASYSLADMKIAQARMDQAAAQQELVRYHIGQATITAPFSGIIVEGDLQERTGLPVRQGDALFKVARIEHLYAEASVSERDVRELQNVRSAEMALTSRPQAAVPMNVTRIQPELVPRDKGNVILVDCGFPQGPQDWWRPGMTGVAKLSVGDRRLLWILAHRTTDFLRLRLWW